MAIKRRKLQSQVPLQKRLLKAIISLRLPLLEILFWLQASLGNTNETAASSIPDLFENASNGINAVKLNPRAVSFVQDYMETHSEELLKMKDWGRTYFNLMDAVLIKYSLPIELKYLAVIESKLKSTALSRVGAVGPWQLMPVTARELGLKVNAKIDERTNYYKSTTAAALYLRDLYAEFGDWLLVIAAYNGGPGVVYNAVKKSGGSRNFWAIQNYLPNETRNHVKKFIGTHYIFEGQGGITTLTKAETADQISAVSQILSNRNLTAAELADVKTLKVSGKYHSTVIAKMVVMDIDEFNRYNPNFDRVMAKAENTYELKLPQDKMELFVANKYQILNESVQMLLSGATVSAITTSVSRPTGKK
jgi:membrane-bound lytic murein transglycosylase D